jgi:predicted SAM-dependent methyltransferase
MLNYNFGSGTSRRQDFISVDKYIPEADEHWDLTEPLPLADQSVDNIFSAHFIEHLSRDEWHSLRKEWDRVLKQGGTIELYCPDIKKVCEQFIAEPTTANLVHIYGMQDTPGEYHKNGFTEGTLILSFPNYSYEVLPHDDTEIHMKFIKDRKPL